MRKTQQRRHTIFIYCEGKTDRLFVQHLKDLYILRGVKQVYLKRGTGGDLSTYISETVKNAQVRDFDEKYIVLDSNGKKEQKLKRAEEESQKHKIQLIWQRPCLEGVFLRILKGEQFIREKSRTCKSVFNKEYMSDNTPLTETLLKRLFTKNILDKKRKEIKELDQLIQLMKKRGVFNE